ncbi:uncharacterized protein LOC126742387 [Anthonomus grandis grandis]|uniref:uncharacterized protein LOC126742387 n=1 Tax=Anthonomus grandis grandis TaxID=2921223 RepID=UPI0021664716|nr:uncharacterized protein LOC126742387 [Anthonomus grandis grandis]
MHKRSCTGITKAPDKDMMEKSEFSPWYSVGKIIPTNINPTVDVFNSFRPERQCVDYNISQTWIKFQKGDLKVNVRQTEGTYADIPPELCKPKKKKKVKHFSGGPPQYKFIEEIWRDIVIEHQTKVVQIHKEVIKSVSDERSKKLRNDHVIAQSMVGPDWFMELNPNQLCAADKLGRAVNLDIWQDTTINCQEVLATIGLVLRPNKKHIKIALKHSCGSPVEFLLVLYQILEPHRTSYSLNDRLILSSVVHLAITDTLRELHIRIPSPPRVPTPAKPPKQKAKKIKYKSPYLEPQTFEPAPPRFTGMYYNKHKQYPESPYFSYMEKLEAERRSYKFSLQMGMFQEDEEMLRKLLKEYHDAQEFYESLPGIRQAMLQLIPPNTMDICPNLRNIVQKPPIPARLIPPHLCKVSPSETLICFCKENQEKGENCSPQAKRTSCEKSAQQLLGSLCMCDDCIENVRYKNLIRIHGGFQKTMCACDENIPIIQGTASSPICDCYRQYRNTIVACAARQRMTDMKLKFLLGGVTMTKYGPIYTINGTRGTKICLCNDILQRKSHLQNLQQKLYRNETKFVINGVTLTKSGAIYNMACVVGRKPCKCVISYRDKLKVLLIQNKLRSNSVLFVNNGLVITQMGPLFHLSNVPGKQERRKDLELHESCSCEIRKAKCFERCMDFLNYKIDNHDHVSSDAEEYSSLETSTSSESSSEVEEDSCEDLGDRNKVICPACLNKSIKQRSAQKYEVNRSCDKTASRAKGCLRSCPIQNSTEEFSEGSESSTTPSQSTTDRNLSSERYYFKPKSCCCKDELDRFMKAKCECEECNQKLRQEYATYIMGGTKDTASGNQINLVQGIRQPQCGCLKEHLENIKKIDEYKSRAQARYHLKKQQKKFCISGVKYTTKGPVYIISGMRPPVDCECAKAQREKEELEAYEQQRAKMPNTGRVKYEIAGVRAMSKENVYIMARALNVNPCECEKFLEKFEAAHQSCLDEYNRFLEKLKLPSDLDLQETEGKRETLLFEEDIQKIMPVINEEAIENTKTAEQTSNIDNPSIPEELDEPTNRSSKTSEQAMQTLSDHLPECEFESSVESVDSNESSQTTSTSVSCHVDKPESVTPITIPSDKVLPPFFLSKRYAIYRNLPKCKKKMMKLLTHILKGMAEDGFSLAKLPEVHKLPIFKLWIERRIGTYWTYQDRIRYQSASKYLWKHTSICYKNPNVPTMPYTPKQARKVTWKDANTVRKQAADRYEAFYRKVKQLNVETGREFFPTTFPYEFPTPTWRDCAFAYIPTKEESIFPFRIVKAHEAQIIPENKKIHCYC